ncbi:MAG: hypothetical protein HQL99_03685 [Magnetococcales bacterium]|nr:hypothetical protein [Magnetococcales bacterium]
MLRIEFNESALNRAVADVGKQLLFASALTLTNVAKDAQAEVRRLLPQKFTIRTGWVAKGIQIRSASKSDLKATVMVLDQFMAIQETGGTKVGVFGKALGVPVGARSSPTSVTRPGSFPGAMSRRPGYFIAPLKKGANVKAVWRRIGKGRRERLKLMYVLPHQVRLKPRFGFNETVRKVAMENAPRRFAEALQKALATAR